MNFFKTSLQSHSKRPVSEPPFPSGRKVASIDDSLVNRLLAFSEMRFAVSKCTVVIILTTTIHSIFLHWSLELMHYIVFVGFAAGTCYDNPGCGVNYQCMPEDNAYSTGGYDTQIAGAEYQSCMTMDHSPCLHISATFPVLDVTLTSHPL